MRVRNVHERVVPVTAERAAVLIDSLSSKEDQLWPRDAWPAMRFDRPLQVGAIGGHGPVRYTVAEYEPGRRVRFRFTAPRGFDGVHEFSVHPAPGGCRLLHVLEMDAGGPALLTWPLVFRPLHDALVEDAFDRAERSLGVAARTSRWSPWVRVLRWMLGAPRR